MTYQPQLDGLRAVCVLFTLFNHIHGAPRWINGTVGVDVFFALSGFLITTLLLVEASETGVICLRSFYIRRAFRIIPLYLLAFGATALAAVAIGYLLHDKTKLDSLKSAWPWILSFNRELCPSETCGPTLFGHAWSIGIEEKFYIFWPVIFALTRKRSLALAGLIGTIVIAVMALMPMQMVRGYVGLSFGCLAALWHETQKRELGVRSLNILWLSLMLAGYVISSAGHEYGNILVSFGSAWLIVSLVHRPDGTIARILAIQPVAWVGKLTYGLYLFHVLVINVVEMALGKLHLTKMPQAWLGIALLSYALSILTALAVHRAIERPMIRFGKSLASSLKSRGTQFVTVMADHDVQPPGSASDAPAA